MLFALSFTIYPVMNLYSSINITRKIAADEHISSYSKQYFLRKSKIYTILVLLSGGSYPALKVMNSNLFASPLLSAGLSTLQIQRFRSYHMLVTVLAENIPQIALQYIFLFELRLYTTTAIVSFTSSIFNILLSIMNAVIFYILYRNQKETAFTILLSWSPKQSRCQPMIREKGQKSDLNPFLRCGQRRYLSILLGRILLSVDETVKFEILSSKRLEGGCLLHGVCVLDNSIAARALRESDGSTFEHFMTQQNKIKDAVMKAFSLDAEYTDLYTFSVNISETAQSTRSEKVKLVINGLKELKVSSNAISIVQRDLDETVDTQNGHQMEVVTATEQPDENKV